MCQKMSNPDRQSMANLGRVVRYLKRETQRGEAFSCGRMAEEVTKFTDSDWTGCTETRKSSSAAVILLGNHALKANTRKQKTIAKSSEEAELCAAALGASESHDQHNRDSDHLVHILQLLHHRHVDNLVQELHHLDSEGLRRKSADRRLPPPPPAQEPTLGLTGRPRRM